MDYYPYPKGATPLYVPLVTAHEPCAAPNRAHAAPLAFGSCAPAAAVSDRLEWGTPDANGASANGSGFVRLRASGSPLGDMTIAAVVTDVRCRAALASCGASNAGGGPDYAGELRGVLPVRLSDRNSGALATEQATLPDLEFHFPIACTETVSDLEGGSCSTATSMNALYPGAVEPGARAVFAFEQIAVEDGGADGLAGTDPNETFLTQGIFAP